MAVEWIANGVRVNAVSPGTIFSQTASDNYAIDVFQMAIPHIPAKRLGKMTKKPRTSAFIPEYNRTTVQRQKFQYNACLSTNHSTALNCRVIG